MVLLPAPAGPSMATTIRFCVVSAKKQDNKRRTARAGSEGLERTSYCLAAVVPVVQSFGVYPKACRFESYLGANLSFLARFDVYPLVLCGLRRSIVAIFRTAVGAGFLTLRPSTSH